MPNSFCRSTLFDFIRAVRSNFPERSKTVIVFIMSFFSPDSMMAVPHTVTMLFFKTFIAGGVEKMTGVVPLPIVIVPGVSGVELAVTTI